MNDPTGFSIVISMVGLTSFLLASGLLVLGFKHTSHNHFWIRLGHLCFAVGTMATTLHALTGTSTALLLAAAVAWGTIVSWFVWQMELVGAFTAPVISITLLTSIFFSSPTAKVALSNAVPAMRVHIASAVLGQSFAILACGMSLLFLWFDNKLKSRQLSDLPTTFPAFATLTRALNATLWIGFIFITLSLLSGAMYALSGLIPPGTNILPKVSWAILVWLWYLSILVLKGILGYRPQRVARMSLAGFVILALSWFGLLFVAPWGAA